MTGLEVDVSGAQQRFKDAGIKVHRAMPKLLARLAGQGERFMKKATPVKTGNLRNSVTSQVSPTEATIWNSANYAKFVNWNTKPHVIRPRRAKALRFFAGGQEVFTKKVHHPGTKGKFFLENTREHLIKIIPTETDKIITEALK